MPLAPDQERSQTALPSECDTVCDVFVKIGGSVLDQQAVTAALVPAITSLGSQHRIVILTGGGQTVKRIKANQRAVGTPFFACWRAGVWCLDVTAHLLASYSTRFAIAASLTDLSACTSAGKVAVFAPAAAILGSLQWLPDWEMTTDSFGLYFARTLGARRYVIVTDVDGIFESRPGEHSTRQPIERINARQLEQLPTSKLDRVFPLYFRRYALPTVIVNGRSPERVTTAIRGDQTIGTKIEATADKSI